MLSGGVCLVGLSESADFNLAGFVLAELVLPLKALDHTACLCSGVIVLGHCLAVILCCLSMCTHFYKKKQLINQWKGSIVVLKKNQVKKEKEGKKLKYLYNTIS